MCMKECDLLEEYTHYIFKVCNIKPLSTYKVHRSIRKQKTGVYRLVAYIDGMERGVTIYFEHCEIIKVYERIVHQPRFIRKLYPEVVEYKGVDDGRNSMQEMCCRTYV